MIVALFWLCVGSIVYTYAGYPLILALLARLRGGEREHPPSTPAVTLLIAAYNEQASIGAKLENTLALDYPRDRLQILVVDDCSDDATPEIAAAYAARGVEVSRTPPRRGKLGAINQAMRLARGEIVVISDANNSYNEQALRALVRPFADPSVGVVGGAKQIAAGDGALGDADGLYWKYESYIKQQESRLGCCTGVAGEIIAFRRELFEPTPPGIINDDFYIAMRIVKRGYRVVYVPEARSSERISPSAQDEITRRSRIIAGRYQAIAMAPRLLPFERPLVVWQVISHKFLRPLVPFAMAGALLANIIAAARPSGGAARGARRMPAVGGRMLALQLAFYALAWAGNRMERRGRVGKALYIPAFFVNSNFAALLGLYRFLRGRQSALWERVQRRDEQAPAPTRQARH